MSDTLLTTRDFIRWGTSQFNERRLTFGHGTDNALDEAFALVLDALHLPHDIPDAYLDGRLSKEERERLRSLLEQRIADRKPAAYLTGMAEFAGLEFQVDESVLVPRSPIAELIEQHFAPWIDVDRVGRILDLCAGSGCIGIAAAYAFPNAVVDLGELSPDAIRVAKANIEELDVADRVTVLESDLFDEMSGRLYDVIVSNPPYVSAEEMANLPEEHRWEPRMGLEAGEGGLEIVVRILRQASRFLKVGGILVVEVGNSEKALVERYPEVPFVWLQFKRGGNGVFLLTRELLAHYQKHFDNG